MTPQEEEARARSRFIVIQLVRTTGLVMLLGGALIVAGRIDLPREAGFVLLVVGLIDMLIAPILLAKRWKSPKE
jgi:hypothetical protein